MKTIATFITLLLFSFFSTAQVMEQIELKDGSIQYYFTLDKFQKSFNYPIEITHLGGDVTKMKATSKSKLSGKIVFKDLVGKVLFEKKLDSSLVFEFNTNLKEVMIECSLKGYAPYIKKLEIEKLSILVLKLQPEPLESIYVINSTATIVDMKIEEIMQCVNGQVIAHPDQKTFTTCDKIYKVNITSD
jgi:hypothetical protein